LVACNQVPIFSISKRFNINILNNLNFKVMSESKNATPLAVINLVDPGDGNINTHIEGNAKDLINLLANVIAQDEQVGYLMRLAIMLVEMQAKMRESAEGGEEVEVDAEKN
jgi:hypothetical protein